MHHLFLIFLTNKLCTTFEKLSVPNERTALAGLVLEVEIGITPF